MNRPVRLAKQNEYTISDKVDAWCTRHITFCLAVALIIFSVLFVALCYAVVGPSGTESGLQYNQINNII